MKYLGVALVYAWRYSFGLLTPEAGFQVRHAVARIDPAERVHRELQHLAGALRAARDSEARFRSVFESGMIGIAFWNSERITSANDALLRMLG